MRIVLAHTLCHAAAAIGFCQATPCRAPRSPADTVYSLAMDNGRAAVAEVARKVLRLVVVDISRRVHQTTRTSR
jgi:hypothetical protein